MEAKLQVHGHSYVLINENKAVAFAHPDDFSNDDIIGNLSLKNCDAIAMGYDMDNLIENHGVEIANASHGFGVVDGYKAGFQKAIELLGDKKYTDGQLKYAHLMGIRKEMSFNQLHDSLQQTEWDVEVVMEVSETYTETDIPRLDSSGNLILKIR